LATLGTVNTWGTNGTTRTWNTVVTWGAISTWSTVTASCTTWTWGAINTIVTCWSARTIGSVETWLTRGTVDAVVTRAELLGEIKLTESIEVLDKEGVISDTSNVNQLSLVGAWTNTDGKDLVNLCAKGSGCGGNDTSLLKGDTVGDDNDDAASAWVAVIWKNVGACKVKSSTGRSSAARSVHGAVKSGKGGSGGINKAGKKHLGGAEGHGCNTGTSALNVEAVVDDAAKIVDGGSKVSLGNGARVILDKNEIGGALASGMTVWTTWTLDALDTCWTTETLVTGWTGWTLETRFTHSTLEVAVGV
jgi:hypothetical protein